jgi:hypothetical protein
MARALDADPVESESDRLGSTSSQPHTARRPIQHAGLHLTCMHLAISHPHSAIGHQRPSTAINGNQQPSTAINSNQPSALGNRPSTAINSTRASTPPGSTTRDSNQQPSTAINSTRASTPHLEAPLGTAINSHQRPSTARRASTPHLEASLGTARAPSQSDTLRGLPTRARADGSVRHPRAAH